MDPLDRRLRLAAASTTAHYEGFVPDGKRVDLRGGTFALPSARSRSPSTRTQLHGANRRLVQLIPVADLAVKGMWARYRWPGIGAPLASRTDTLASQPSEDFVAPWPRCRSRRSCASHRRAKRSRADTCRRSSRSTRPPAEDDRIEGREGAIEIESTAALALCVPETGLEQEIQGFLRVPG